MKLFVFENNEWIDVSYVLKDFDKFMSKIVCSEIPFKFYGTERELTDFDTFLDKEHRKLDDGEYYNFHYSFEKEDNNKILIFKDLQLFLFEDYLNYIKKEFKHLLELKTKF